MMVLVVRSMMGVNQMGKEIVLQLTYALVLQGPLQAAEHMCAGCVFRNKPCMDMLPAGKHCGSDTVYQVKEHEWLS